MTSFTPALGFHLCWVCQSGQRVVSGDLKEKGESRVTNDELDEINCMEVLGEFHRIVSCCDRELENMLLPVTKLRYKPA